MRQGQDREAFLDDRIQAMKPVFKNFINNNSNILRGEHVRDRLKEFKEKELAEEEI